VLWRSAYQPRVLESRKLDGLPEGIVVGVFDPLGQAELGVWLRLFESAGWDRDVSILAIGMPGRRKFESVLPPSRHSQIVWLDESGLRQTLEIDKPERSFAAVIVNGVADLLVVGVPTEEVWERFEQALVTSSLVPPPE